jgi:hypothetical protein
MCGAWRDDGCEHYDDETGEVKPEFTAAAAAAYEADRLAAEAEAAHGAEAERLAEEYWKSLDDDGKPRV